MTMGERGYYFARIVDHGTALPNSKMEDYGYIRID
jgi:hypothetical protein